MPSGFISRDVYKKDVTTYHMHDYKLMDTPIERNMSLSFDMCPKSTEEKGQMSKVLYSSAIGSLMYAMMHTHPDICYAVGLASRFQSNPGIKGITDYVLCYQGRDLRLIGYTDAD